ncbi:hypothetical protein SADUNF_Sadunf15G0020200 [Salix dunnii]|uniref:Uncharacterized protein n=1 Tax=Salix dunnii TaxID=1413687 RepID=A0A835JDH4_9ROSI|nr:hypothetical protein SADUNF_Sadunf15G0020200 [Salix dunnii]
MAVSNISSGVFAATVAMIGAIFMPLAHGQSSAPAPSPTSDGTQGRAEFWLACEKVKLKKKEKVREYEVIQVKDVKTVVGKEENSELKNLEKKTGN